MRMSSQFLFVVLPLVSVVVGFYQIVNLEVSISVKKANIPCYFAIGGILLTATSPLSIPFSVSSTGPFGRTMQYVWFLTQISNHTTK